MIGGADVRWNVSSFELCRTLPLLGHWQDGPEGPRRRSPPPLRYCEQQTAGRRRGNPTPLSLRGTARRAVTRQSRVGGWRRTRPIDTVVVTFTTPFPHDSGPRSALPRASPHISHPSCCGRGRTRRHSVSRCGGACDVPQARLGGTLVETPCRRAPSRPRDESL